MLKRVWASFIHRGVSFWFALGVGLNAGGSAMLITYIIGGLCLLIALGIFIYNLKQPIEDQIPSMLDTIKDSKSSMGFLAFWSKSQRTFPVRHCKENAIA